MAMIRQLAGKTVVYGGGELLARLMAFAAVPILTSLIPPGEYGKLALLTSIGGLVAAIGALGLNSGVQRFYYEDPAPAARSQLISSGWLLLAAMLVATSLVAGLLAIPLVGVIQEHLRVGLPLLLLALLAAILFQVSLFGLDLFRLESRPYAYSLAQVLRGGGTAVLSIVLVAVCGMGIDGILLSSVASLGLLSIILVGASGARYGWSPTRSDLTRLFAFGSPYILVNTTAWAYGSLDRWLLARLGGLETVGIYSVAILFSEILTFVVMSFSRAWGPMVYQLHSEQPDDHRSQLGQMWTVWGGVLLSVAVGLMLFAPELIMVMAGDAYRSAGPILVLLLASVAIGGTTQMTAQGISIRCRTDLYPWLTGAALGVNLLVNLLTIPRWGVLGAGVAAIACQLVLTTLYCWQSQRLYRCPVRWSAIWLFGMIGFFAMVVAFWLSSFPWGWWQLPLKAVLLLLVLVIVVRVGGREEMARKIFERISVAKPSQ